MTTHISRAQMALAALLVLALLPGSAMAEEEPMPFDFGPYATWHLMVGPTGGGSFGQGAGGYIGGEASFGALYAGYWGGAFFDGVYDFKQGHGILSAGPQFGWLFLGLDAGAAVRTDAWSEPGVHARLLLTMAYFGLYGRYTHFADDYMGQVGVLFKIPVWASAGE